MITLPQTQEVGNPQVHASPPIPTPPVKPDRRRLIILIAILIIVSGATVLSVKTLIELTGKEGEPFALGFLKEPKKEGAKSSFPVSVQPAAPTPTPRLLPQGKVSFDVQSSKKTGPRLTKGFIDPYDPKPGEKQTMTIYAAKSTKPVTNKTVTIKSDHDIITYTFETQSQTAEQEIWTASWTVSDTHTYTYVAIIEAENEEGINKTEVMLR